MSGSSPEAGKDSWCDRVALAICVLSAAWGAVVIALGTEHAARDILWVACAWAVVGQWLEGFRTLRQSPLRIYQDYLRAGVKRSPLGKVARYGAVFLFVLAIVWLL